MTQTTETEAEKIAKEFEDFVYIVSHDYKAPIRHIKQFTELLIAARGDGLSEEETQYVGFIEKALQTLEGMQDSLLVYSRLNTQAGPKVETDLNAIIDEEAKKLGISASHSNIPVLNADPNQIRLLWHHLLDNAAKFNENPLEDVKVDITAEEKDDCWQFMVADNGIGIAEKNHDDVFRMFHRLHPSDYDGMGAGLPIARKIVQIHGGDITIQPDTGQGTKIIFTLSKSL